MNEQNIYKAKERLDAENLELKNKLVDRECNISSLQRVRDDLETEVKRCAGYASDIFELRKHEISLLDQVRQLEVEQLANLKAIMTEKENVEKLEKSQADLRSEIVELHKICDVGKEAIVACEEVNEVKFEISWPLGTKAKLQHSDYEFIKKLIASVMTRTREIRELFVKHKIGS